MKITEKTFHETCRRGWCGDMRRGAAMGRGSRVPPSPVGQAHLIRVRLSSGGYAARGGAYFGHGAPLYWLYQATPDGGVTLDYTFRAESRAAAVAHVVATMPNVRVRK